MLNQKQIHFVAKFLFRGGFASIFLVNALVAVFAPEGFKAMISSNIVGQFFPDLLLSVMIYFIALNDLLTGVIILSGKWRYFVYIWSGLWLLLIAGIKVTNLIW